MKSEVKPEFSSNFDEEITTQEFESPARSIYKSTIPPQWIETKLEELSNSKADKETLQSEISHLKDMIKEYKAEACQDSTQLHDRVLDLDKKQDKFQGSLTNVYKWFSATIITLLLSFIGSGAYFIFAASDISSQVMNNSDHIISIEKSIDKIDKKIDKDDHEMIQKVVKETLNSIKDPS